MPTSGRDNVWLSGTAFSTCIHKFTAMSVTSLDRDVLRSSQTKDYERQTTDKSFEFQMKNEPPPHLVHQVTDTVEVIL